MCIYYAYIIYMGCVYTYIIYIYGEREGGVERFIARNWFIQL